MATDINEASSSQIDKGPDISETSWTFLLHKSIPKNMKGVVVSLSLISPRYFLLPQVLWSLQIVIVAVLLPYDTVYIPIVGATYI